MLTAIKAFLRLFFIFVVFPSLVVGAIYFLDQKGFFNLAEIKISFEEEMQNPQYYKPLVEDLQNEMHSYLGLSLWKLPFSEISEKVSRKEWIKKISVVRNWPSTLTLEIRPQSVVAVYVSEGNKFYPMNELAEFLKNIPPTQTPDVVLLRGSQFSKIEIRKKAIDLLEQLPEKGSFSAKEISEISYEAQSGFVVTLVKSGIKVLMGEDQFAIKSNRVSQVIEYMNSHHIKGRVIDSNFSKKVLVRMRKDL